MRYGKDSRTIKPHAKIDGIDLKINQTGLSAVIWRGAKYTVYRSISLASFLRIKKLAEARVRESQEQST
jgi:hypothetical protein